MPNNRSYPPLTFPSLPPSSPLCHANTKLPYWNPYHGVMLLFHAFNSIGFLLLFLHLFSILLTTLFSFLHYKATHKGDVEYKLEPAAVEPVEREDLVADILEGETLLFLYSESAKYDGALLSEQGKDSKELTSLEEEDTCVAESAYCSPLENLARAKLGFEFSYDDDVAITNVLLPSDSDNVALEDDKTVDEEVTRTNEEDETIIAIGNSHPISEKIHVEEVQEDHKENFSGFLTGDSTSKSSIEWRSSTIFRDSETEYPFSSSSRRSSSNWESYTVFRKYDEEMLLFDRITAQKLSETESLRSIKVQPRSISERIVHKLSTKPKNHRRGKRSPFEELESAYVAQICLTWEALNWNYINFLRKNSNASVEGSGCPARIAQQFQQFQVLLQRFIENEPYEFGRRPEVYARRRISSPKLLQVPEFRDSEADDGGNDDMSSNISSSEFLVILEDCIRTFMNFLKADKEKCSDIFKALIKKKATSVDPTFLRFLKKVNKKKKLRLRDLGRRQRCALRKRKLKEDEEMEMMMALIDLKVVSRVLRIAEITEEQLHWCEEKMGKVRVWDGKMQRDSSPLFFPVH